MFVVQQIVIYIRSPTRSSSSNIISVHQQHSNKTYYYVHHQCDRLVTGNFKQSRKEVTSTTCSPVTSGQQKLCSGRIGGCATIRSLKVSGSIDAKHVFNTIFTTTIQITFRLIDASNCYTG